MMYHEILTQAQHNLKKATDDYIKTEVERWFARLDEDNDASELVTLDIDAMRLRQEILRETMDALGDANILYWAYRDELPKSHHENIEDFLNARIDKYIGEYFRAYQGDFSFAEEGDN